MGIQLEDGLGSGVLAQIINDRVRVLSVASSLTNHLSTTLETVYTVIGTYVFAGAAATVYPLFIRNDDPNNFLVIDSVLVQAVGMTGGTATPSVAEYFSLGLTQTYTVGGTDVVPVNLNRVSTNAATGIFKQGNPTLGGTLLESHRVYPIAGSIPNEPVIVRGNDLILGRGKSLTIRYTSDKTAGTVMACIKFFYATAGHMG